MTFLPEAWREGEVQEWHSGKGIGRALAYLIYARGRMQLEAVMHCEEFTPSDLQAARDELARIEREIFRSLNEDTKTRFAAAYDRVMKIRRSLRGAERSAPSKLA